MQIQRTGGGGGGVKETNVDEAQEMKQEQMEINTDHKEPCRIH